MFMNIKLIMLLCMLYAIHLYQTHTQLILYIFMNINMYVVIRIEYVVSYLLI